jgi:hypothetical protein
MCPGEFSLAEPLPFLCPGAKSDAEEPDAPSLAPEDAPERSCDAPPDFKPDEPGPEELGPEELGPEFDIPAPPPFLPISPAPCANAIGAPTRRAAIATEYFNICVSYAESIPPWLDYRTVQSV